MVTPQTKGKDGSHPVKILALESSAVAASAALCEDETLIAQAFQNSGLTHSQTLLPMVEHLLQGCSLTPADLDLIAVAAGPGSFTGLRIGVATAKGLAWAAQRPCAGCSTLESMSWNLAGFSGQVCAAMDARRHQIYNARFQVDGQCPRRLTPDRAISLDDLVQELAGTQTPQLVVGDGAQLCYDALTAAGIPAVLAPPNLRMQSAWGGGPSGPGAGPGRPDALPRAACAGLSPAVSGGAGTTGTGAGRPDAPSTINRKGEMEQMEMVHVLDHPLLQHKLSILRDETTGVKDFREIVCEIATLMCYDATRNLPLQAVEVQTPVAKAVTYQLAGKKLAIVPVLRAGLGMVEGILTLIPSAKVGHIGLFRDPDTLEPVKYYCKMPTDIADRDVIILDPMLATGGSASAAISFVKEYGVKNIKLMNILAAPEGIARVRKDHPDVEIYVAAVDDQLNDHGYIVPGLGDAGDRIFGTK